MKNISIDAKTAGLLLAGFVIGNIYGTMTTMSITKKGVTMVKGYIIK